MNKKQIIFAIVFCALAVMTLTTCKPREDSAETVVCEKATNYTTNIINSITDDCRERGHYMKNSKIEWCDSTWNPITGCLHDCEYCYARRIANRFKGYDKITFPDLSVSKGLNVLEIPAVKNGKAAPYPFGFKPTFHKYLLDKPQSWKKPRNVFVCSMADLFGEWVPNEWIEQVFAACEAAPQHNYLFLTKNPKRYLSLALAGKLPASSNMWFGSTVTTSKNAFFSSGKYKTFLSVEPLHSDIEIDGIQLIGISWIVIGAETGKHTNKITPKKEWVDSIVKSFDLLKRPIFMKDSLVPIVGEENMRREFPWKK